MAPRILTQLVLFLLPFILFGLYRVAVTEAKMEGRKPWPIRALFAIGTVLAVGSWFIFILLDRGGREDCYRPSYRDAETGKFIPGETYACDKDYGAIGVPQSEDPGGIADGVGERQDFDGTRIQIDENTAESLEDDDGR